MPVRAVTREEARGLSDEYRRGLLKQYQEVEAQVLKRFEYYERVLHCDSSSPSIGEVADAQIRAPQLRKELESIRESINNLVDP